MKRFSLLIISLTAFMLGLIWAVGSGEAYQGNRATASNNWIFADTVKINVDDETAAGGSEVEPVDSRETLLKEIRKLNSVVYDIKNRYMEEVDTKDLINAGIEGMLQNLDRFSVLMEKQSYDRLMESTHGKYEGLGMEIDSRDDYIIVVTPMEGTPAYNMGLHPGDQIRAIDGESTYKMTTSDASKLMRGTAGTKVNLTIMRPGLASPLDFDVERAVIELKSVNYYGVVEGTNIGYVRLSRFAEETTNELIDAISDLKKQNVDGLIFDLRSNGGGLLQQAVQVAGLFMQDGRLVVYSKGQFPGSEKRYYSGMNGATTGLDTTLFPEKPLVMLVDEGTASASEIVAGAIQDWDRGVIMGHRTYGKGLVQQLFPVGDDDDNHLKLTTARYYIPSGRCIQKPEVEKKGDMHAGLDDMEPEVDTVVTDTVKLSDKEVFYTNAGRTVYGGGGILPDLEVDEARPYEPIEINLERKTMFFDFAVKYVAEHPDATRNIVVTDDIVNDFRSYIKEKDFAYKTALEVSLDEMKKIVDEEKKDDLFSGALTEFSGLVEKEKEADFTKSIDYIRKAIKREIVSKIGGQRAVYEDVILKTDPGILKAVELLKNKSEYSKIFEAGRDYGRKAPDEN
ncbi:MAG: hypothetical protein CVT49_11525 [candidate division Zixibacteria bacterium HGW-Zixibacteria-1]|nr:MAG: hypothetical protein CVT49_11525 [candidate division Zixibacteria bacterium HGW-Zixibacteria-1]